MQLHTKPYKLQTLHAVGGVERSLNLSTVTPNPACRLVVNEGLAWSSLPQLVSLYVPISMPTSDYALPHLDYASSDQFRTSAVLAALLDSVLLPCRLKAGGLETGEEGWGGGGEGWRGQGRVEHAHIHCTYHAAPCRLPSHVHAPTMHPPCLF